MNAPPFKFDPNLRKIYKNITKNTELISNINDLLKILLVNNKKNIKVN